MSQFIMQKPDEAARLEMVYGQYRESDLENSRWSEANPGNQAIIQERRRIVHRLLEETGFIPLADRRILEVGCGLGKVLAKFHSWGALPQNLYGVDVLADSIEIARRDYPRFKFHTGSAECLPFEQGYFDLVLFFTVFTSIHDDRVAADVAAEARRVLRPGGAVVWYDFRYDNPFNSYVRGVPRKDIVRHFPGFKFQIQTATLLPPLARRLGRLTGWCYPRLVKLPFLRTHYVGVLIKPAA